LVRWLHELPAVVGACLVVLSFLVPTIIGVSFLQPIIGRLLRREKDPNLPVGFLLNAFTLYYAVLLALLSIAVLQNYNKAGDAVGREATALIAFYRDLRGYPEPARSELISLLQRYLDEETGSGWSSQRTGETTSAAALVNKIDQQITTVRPEGTVRDEALHFNTLERFNDWVEARRARIQAVRTHIPPILWYVVVIGAALNVVVMWLFDLGRLTHLIVSGVLISFIGLVIYMVAALDRPFLGPGGIGPDYLLHARQQIQRP
jgi:hypothetical protein